MKELTATAVTSAPVRHAATATASSTNQIRQGFADTIGNTPLIRLRSASKQTGCNILGKAEFLNPGSSVKDRAALYIVKDAEEQGLLKPGGGYKTVIVIPETQSQEKKDMLRISGAELVQVPAVPYKNPNNYVKYSQRLAEELAKTHPAGAIWGRQFDNTANRRAHYETTGPEIWRQTDGKIDGFICAVGTGGTLAGTGKYLKEKNPSIRIGLADPMGAALFNYYENGELASSGSSITEGIGQGRITGNLEGWGQPAREGGVVDFWCQVPDEEALPCCYDLLQNDCLCLGPSSGVNVAGTIRLARELGPGHTIVTILCDYGTRYQAKLYNVAFLQSKNLPYPQWLDDERADRMTMPSVFEPVE
ncbi:hypothetical protein WJX72_000859 [[Myrmecia] bisecta]|uniref:Tryptophan synthase beta chain-like PALP domain-containing protein n=1 Tax=[Myrmecia] bisecta TaxID=41462 RepID=A0AAW1R4X7_9CHLO